MVLFILFLLSQKASINIARTSFSILQDNSFIWKRALNFRISGGFYLGSYNTSSLELL